MINRFLFLYFYFYFYLLLLIDLTCFKSLPNERNFGIVCFKINREVVFKGPHDVPEIGGLKQYVFWGDVNGMKVVKLGLNGLLQWGLNEILLTLEESGLSSQCKVGTADIKRKVDISLLTDEPLRI